jgi:DNA-binding winged helix-turn-helix (wHTH) protein
LLLAHAGQVVSPALLMATVWRWRHRRPRAGLRRADADTAPACGA